MAAKREPLDLTFLGSGNAFAPAGRAFSSFLVNGRYLFDCGPTVLQQLHKAGLSSEDIDLVLISHFHADHYFGLPFLFLDGWQQERTRDLWIAGPPGIEARCEQLMALAYPSLPKRTAFRRYVEIGDGVAATAAGLSFRTTGVSHVPDLECFAYRVDLGGRTLVYSGDTTLCTGILEAVEGAEVIVIECSCAGEGVHLSPAGVAAIAERAPGAKVVVTHLDGHDHPDGFDGLIVASDLARFRF